MTALPNTFRTIPTSDFPIAPRIVTAILMLCLMIGGLGGWLITAKLNGAVIAGGTVAVQDNVKTVQHRDGGTVSAILVRDGDTVAAGQVILQVEDAQTRAELAIVNGQIVELTARKARLIAEREGAVAIAFPAGFASDKADEIASARDEERLFTGKLTHRLSQISQLEEGIRQIEIEIAGLNGQRDAKADEVRIVQADLERMQSLRDRNLTEIGRLTTVEREQARMRGELSEIESATARAQSRINETRMQILAINDTARTEAQQELSSVQTKLAELTERRDALQDRLSRADVRAPIAGIVNDLSVHTVGGVITPAETLLTLVPLDAKLDISFRVSPAQIEQVRQGIKAKVRFPAFNQRTTPELFGTVNSLSPAPSRDPVSGETFYKGLVDIEAAELSKLGDAVLMPGMPVEVHVQTKERTVASYLMKPLVDQFGRAFRER
ncbi:HlyD family secretion protein [Loktanella atrilutea]|uniref:Membrane fusion protein (MFP) family protein n=1 Tax=Loktanella atrilutea TaxID=366533 RepID=A0A1M5FC37_LOKAT|nr:HlyD family type I secretion periplasmic adaptor subunit [Loktanella atrilutea]SHF89046.1 HlyD family secretion protein [Loktanella atrilutea]